MSVVQTIKAVLSVHHRGVSPSRVDPVLDRDTRHSNTHSYSWDLSGEMARRKGEPMVVASARRQYSLYVSGPCAIMGTLDDRDWFTLETYDASGIYPAPECLVRAIYPVAPEAKRNEDGAAILVPLRVTLFLNDRGA